MSQHNIERCPLYNLEAFDIKGFVMWVPGSTGIRLGSFKNKGGRRHRKMQRGRFHPSDNYAVDIMSRHHLLAAGTEAVWRERGIMTGATPYIQNHGNRYTGESIYAYLLPDQELQPARGANRVRMSAPRFPPDPETDELTQTTDRTPGDPGGSTGGSGRPYNDTTISHSSASL